MRICLLLLAMSIAGAQEAPTIFVPPVKGETQGATFPAEVLKGYLKTGFPSRVFRDFAGKNKVLEKTAEETGGPLRIAEGLEAGVDAQELFDKPIIEGPTRTWLTAIRSIDAYALRAELDLSGLEEGEELWVVEPGIPRAFGPYGRGDQQGNSFWTPTVEGDTIVLMLRSALTSLPPLRLEGLSHFFRPLIAAETKCPINVACEQDELIRQASTAVGRLHITLTNGSTILCSGSLINAPDTAAEEPYFLTANHCFTAGTEESIEVIWDYRRPTCDGVDPALGSLPHTLGGDVLVTSGPLDFAFLELSEVPDGTEGRAYLGWSLTKAVLGNEVIGMHHPQGRSMKICYGHITGTDLSSIYGRLQNEIQWDDGITEGGSSGSPALFRDELLVMGVLSNGAQHVCGRPEGNVDNYSSFREFYPAVACYLTESANCAEETVTCPAKVTFGEESAEVAALRVFRDDVLTKSSWGRSVIHNYYQHAPELAELVRRSPQTRAAFSVLALPAALLERLGR